MIYLSLEAPICSLQTKYALIRLKNEDLTSQTVSPTLKDSSPLGLRRIYSSNAHILLPVLTVVACTENFC